MNKIFYLKSCSTCTRIIKELKIDGSIELREIKGQIITENELDELAKGTGSYEALFSKKSQKYRPLGLHEKNLTEKDYRSLILSEYTFIKRPVFQINGNVFAGNSKEVVEQAKVALAQI